MSQYRKGKHLSIAKTESGKRLGCHRPGGETSGGNVCRGICPTSASTMSQKLQMKKILPLSLLSLVEAKNVATPSTQTIKNVVCRRKL